MLIKTRRWNDPPDRDEGHRLLNTRYRPRGVSKHDETWDVWEPTLGPSKALHGAVYQVHASPIPWLQYRRKYINEQKTNKKLIQDLARRASSGETITLLCSSACTRESRCHRAILRELIENAMGIPGDPSGGG